MQKDIVDAESEVVAAQAAASAAATALTAATNVRDSALNAMITHAAALTGAAAAPYQMQIATINSTTATAAQKTAARLTIAAEVNSRATDTSTANDPSSVLSGLSSAYQRARSDYDSKNRAKARADHRHYDALVASRQARADLATFMDKSARVLVAESGEKSAILSDLSRALREADENQYGTADHDKPIAILAVSLDLHSKTTAAYTGITAAQARLTSLNRAIAANNRLIESNKAEIIASSRHIYNLYERTKILADGMAAAYALAGVPHIPGRLNLTISAGEFDGEAALGITLHGQMGRRLAFSGALVRTGSKDALAAGVTIGL